MKRHTVFGGLVAGGIAGGVATWVMDLVTTGMQAGQSPGDAALEKAAQVGGRSSIENLLELLEARAGVRVADDLRPIALHALHYGLGVGPGAVYGMFRGRVPMINAGRGLLFGALLWALNDEYLNSVLGLAGKPDAYPASTHLRGLVGHLALGATTDTILDVL